MQPISPLAPECDSVVVVGGGRNAYHTIGFLEQLDVRVHAILDDRPSFALLGHRTEAIDGYAGPVWTAVLTVTNPVARRDIVARDAGQRFTWVRYVDPRSVLHSHARIGIGSFIGPFVTCSNVDVGQHVTVWGSVGLGSNVTVGDFSCVLHGASVAGDAVIGSCTVIGVGARILEGVRIGRHCVVAPNAVVRYNIPDDSFYVETGGRYRIVARRETAGAPPLATEDRAKRETKIADGVADAP